ncbi:probabable response regulator of two-component system (plasmid) [Sinorhizobium meliloti SM11]|uniref:Probabable response regulator of two-component system n=1 Tax=Sinorhizobium meliloti (strain SM11) TaxID=707241 RepID=F7XEX7_SINMM|nr:probabable response regulator of two-component system [Sinorhizobium meliloti SM11]
MNGRCSFVRRDARSTIAPKRCILFLPAPRESQVFDLIVRGKRNKQIAFELNTSERTVKAHRHKVMEKLGVRSLAEVVSMAERLGLLEKTT